MASERRDGANRPGAGHSPPCPVHSAPIASPQSPQIKWASGLAHAFMPQDGQVYLVLLAAFFLRVAASPSPARSWYRNAVPVAR